MDNSNLFDVSGKVIVVTGASGLLGSNFSRELSKLGAKVVLADIASEEAETIAQELNNDCIGVTLDVSKKESWISLKEKVLSEFGKIDVLVNNAAFTNQSKSTGYDSNFSDFPLDAWEDIMKVNLTGTFLGCQIIGDWMCKNNGGSIINFSSLYGVVSPNHTIYEGTGISQPVAYSVSKSGVVSLTKYLGALWGKHNVRVNSISPGGVENKHNEVFLQRYSVLNPMKRMADKSEMLGAVVYLSSEASSYCNGHNLVVDGGWSIW